MDKEDPVLFPLGRKLITKNALSVLSEAGVTPNRLFECHAAGDLGGDRGQELISEQDDRR
jgi:hypothetical protein